MIGKKIGEVDKKVGKKREKIGIGKRDEGMKYENERKGKKGIKMEEWDWKLKGWIKVEDDLRRIGKRWIDEKILKIEDKKVEIEVLGDFRSEVLLKIDEMGIKKESIIEENEREEK